MMIFYDSVTPHRIPRSASHAALYFDGKYACLAADAARFPNKRWITISGDYHNCGIADYEETNPVYEIPGLLAAFVASRNAMGKRARVYSDRNNIPRASAELAGRGLEWEWWIATLDRDRLDPEWIPNLWGVQFDGGMHAAYDTSVLYRDW